MIKVNLPLNKEISINYSDIINVDDLLNKIIDGSKYRTKYVNIYVNGDDIRFSQGLKTNVHDEDIVSIVPSMAGG